MCDATGDQEKTNAACSENVEALAAGIESLHRSPEACAGQAAEGARWVEQFDAARVAGLFLDAIGGSR